MKKQIKIIISMIITTIIILIGATTVQAKSYSIENMDIQATIEPNGSVTIKQQLTYDFKGSYNGIYINIPYQLEDEERKEVASKSILEDKLYNANNVQVKSVSQIVQEREIPFTQVTEARNGNTNVYTTEKTMECNK